MFLIVSTAAFAKSLPDETAAKDLANKIMAKVEKNDLDAAFKMMKPYTSIGSAEIDSIVIQSKASREKFRQNNGASIGYEFIDSKKAGDSLLRFRYIEKNEKHLLLWVFYFYKAKEGWISKQYAKKVTAGSPSPSAKATPTATPKATSTPKASPKPSPTP